MSFWKEGDVMNLYPHQKQGLKATEGMNHVAYFWDMGL
jgi:hypothetical protein